MKIDRLLEIVILLLGRESVTARELAEHFGVTVRTIQRDMTSIALAGIPLYANPGRSGGYSILPEYRLDGQLMKPEDCRWIARALDSLATSYSGYPLERLADRFNAMAARSGAPHIYWDLTVTRENRQVQDTNALLERAIGEKRLVRFHYRNAEGMESDRQMQTLAIHYKWYAWYVFGYDPAVRRYVTCKVARMSEVQPTEERIDVDHGDVRERMRQSEQEYYATCVPVDIRFAPEQQGLMAEYFPDCAVERLSDGECRIILNVPQKERLWKALLLSFGDKVRVAGPAEYVCELKDTARAFLRGQQE